MPEWLKVAYRNEKIVWQTVNACAAQGIKPEFLMENLLRVSLEYSKHLQQKLLELAHEHPAVFLKP